MHFNGLLLANLRAFKIKAVLMVLLFLFRYEKWLQRGQFVFEFFEDILTCYIDFLFIIRILIFFFTKIINISWFSHPNNKIRLSLCDYGTDFSENTGPNLTKICMRYTHSLRMMSDRKKNFDFAKKKFFFRKFFFQIFFFFSKIFHIS